MELRSHITVLVHKGQKTIHCKKETELDESVLFLYRMYARMKNSFPQRLCVQNVKYFEYTNPNSQQNSHPK